MHSLGRIKAPLQKLVMPLITVEIRTCLPANDTYFEVHELIFDLICCRRGSQLARESFRVFSGKPRYRMGKEPAGIPLVETIVSISGSVKPLEKKQDFSTLTERPENALNSSRT